MRPFPNARNLRRLWGLRQRGPDGGRMSCVNVPVLQILRRQNWIMDVRRFSALRVSALLVKLKLPVITVSPSRIIILLWAMACVESIRSGTPSC
jgi:hypothetical protein